MIRFVLADLRQYWVGAAAIALLVAFATALGMTVRIEERALRLGSARAADRFDMVIGAPGSETQLVLSSIFLQPSPLTLLPGETLKTLSEDPRVEFAAPVGFGDSFRGHQIIGTTAEFIEKSGFGITEGRNFAEKFDAVVGARVPLSLGTTMRPLHGVAGEAVGEHRDISYRVVGRMPLTATPWDRAILVPIEGVWHTHGLHNESHHTEEPDENLIEGEETERLGPPWTETLAGVPAILVKPKSIANAYQLRGEYRTEATLAVFPGEVLTRLYATLGDARMVLTGIAMGTQALAAAAVILVAMAHLSQRRRQIGALRAFGAPRLAIFTMVWAELLVIIGFGVACGVGIGYFAAKTLSLAVLRQSGVPLPVTLDLSDLLFAAALLVVAALVVLLPAGWAYRQSPVDALRSNT